jgi:MA3 domain
MSSLLAYLHTSEVISSAQVSVGFDRLWESVSDLSLDMPHAPELLEKFTQQAIQVCNVLSHQFINVLQ